MTPELNPDEQEIYDLRAALAASEQRVKELECRKFSNVTVYTTSAILSAGHDENAKFVLEMNYNAVVTALAARVQELTDRNELLEADAAHWRPELTAERDRYREALEKCKLHPEFKQYLEEWNTQCKTIMRDENQTVEQYWNLLDVAWVNIVGMLRLVDEQTANALTPPPAATEEP